MYDNAYMIGANIEVMFPIGSSIESGFMANWALPEYPDALKSVWPSRSMSMPMVL